MVWSGWEINLLLAIRVHGPMLALDPRFKANHWFSSIRIERSSRSHRIAGEDVEGLLAIFPT
jgi:hypothetical protein